MLRLLNVFENSLVCFIIASHMLRDDVRIKLIRNVSLILRRLIQGDCSS